MIRKLIPSWMRMYQPHDLRGDISAGLIVAIMLVPQGMAYAMLAGLPPVAGLYAATLPLIIYALFGSSRQLAVGPVAMIALLVLSGVSSLAEPGSPEFISLVLSLALMSGIIQLVMGLFKLGFIVNFLSHAVISGFTSAAAIIIAFSQLKHLLGVNLSSEGNIFALIVEAFQKIGETNLITFSLGLGSIIVLVVLKKTLPRFPAPLLIVAGTTLLVYLFNLEEKGVKIIGEVPKGLPGFSLPAFQLDSVMALLPIALTILFVGFMESIAVAKAIAAKEKYKIDSNKELKGLGLANIASSFFSAMPVTGGFSRSAVNYQAGARTGLSSIITAVLIMITLLFFTDLFYYLPNAVLAAIIMVAVYGLIDVKEAKKLFKIKKTDGWILVITFMATLMTSIETGILIGAGVSLAAFIWRSAYPHTAQLGYLESKNVYKNVKRHPDAKTFKDTLIFRMDASLYFANMAFFEEVLRKEIGNKPNTKKVILDFSGVNAIDAVAVTELEKLMDEFVEMGIELAIAGMKGPVQDLIKRAGLDEKYGDNIGYFSIHHALGT